MKPFFQYDTNDHRRDLLIRAGKVALTALQQYDVAWEKIQFIGLSDTITYKIEASPTQVYLLRIHSDRMSKEEIRSELVFLQELNKLEDLSVPVGVASRDGSYVLEVDIDEGYHRPYVTIMHWVEGEHLKEITDDHAFQMGLLMGKLHQAAMDFSPPADFVRPAWDVDSFRTKMARLERYYSCFLSSEGWGLYQVAAEKIRSDLSAMSSNDDNYGLIHGDLHSGNIVFSEELPAPIDFGMCGYGYFLYDIAGALLELNPKLRRKYIQGYESIRRLESGYVRHLECFFVMVMIENYCHHSSDPRETSSLIHEQPYAQAYIRQYLNDISFLFEGIEPVTPGIPSVMDRNT